MTKKEEVGALVANNVEKGREGEKRSETTEKERIDDKYTEKRGDVEVRKRSRT